MLCKLAAFCFLNDHFQTRWFAPLLFAELLQTPQRVYEHMDSFCWPYLFSWHYSLLLFRQPFFAAQNSHVLRHYASIHCPIRRLVPQPCQRCSFQHLKRFRAFHAVISSPPTPTSLRFAPRNPHCPVEKLAGRSQRHLHLVAAGSLHGLCEVERERS